MRELPEPKARSRWPGDDDLWSGDQVLAIQKQAYEDGLRDAIGEPVAFRIFDKDPYGGKDDRWIYYSKEEFREGVDPTTWGFCNLYTTASQKEPQ